MRGERLPPAVLPRVFTFGRINLQAGSSGISYLRCLYPCLSSQWRKRRGHLHSSRYCSMQSMVSSRSPRTYHSLQIVARALALLAPDGTILRLQGLRGLSSTLVYRSRFAHSYHGISYTQAAVAWDII